jgi:hypothetical protein
MLGGGTGASPMTGAAGVPQFGAFGAFASPTTRESDVATPFPMGNLSGLFVHLAAPPGNATGGGVHHWTFTVDVDGSSTGLSCSVWGPQTSCRAAGVIFVGAGATVALRIASDATDADGPASTSATWSATLQPIPG